MSRGRQIKQSETSRVMAAEGWMPYYLVRHRDGRLLELISYSFPSESDEWVILVRLPGDPTSLQRENLCELTVLHARCEWDANQWRPFVQGEYHCHILCPKCGRNYNAVYKGAVFQNEFQADTTLQFIPKKAGNTG